MSPLDSTFPPSIYYRFLYLVAKTFRPDIMLELGVNGGGGSFYLAKGNPDGLVLGVDSANPYPDKIKYLESQCPNFRFYQEDSLTFARSSILATFQVDLIFFDTLHTKPHVLKEFGAYKPSMGDSCLLIFDDLKRPEFGNFWETFPEQKIRLDDLHEEGFGVAWL